ncbi:hypothetical protein ETAA8_13100 [Anatilimnocola aggregata]|uniref:Uncharacterized protein n=1 Tax=Anatilimnocola aggregata TaxID=2528021 RepID=A0A517Y7N1_9BACT|nr:hypothetical protein ETAA8_13100 [Anatilimnocola aggregata]
MIHSIVTSATRFIVGGGRLASSASRQTRLATCHGCEIFSAGRCQSCGCFVAIKSWLAHETCPLGKWDLQQLTPPATEGTEESPV